MFTLKLVESLDKLNRPEWDALCDQVIGPDVHPARRETFLFTREALRLALCEYYTEPKISDLMLEGYGSLRSHPDAVVSLSHTKGTGVALVSQKSFFRSLGCDVEWIQRDVRDEVVNKIAHPQDAKLRNLEVWIRKEAAFKCLSNSGLLKKEPLFTDIAVTATTWSHSPSGLAGECDSWSIGQRLAGLAFLKN